MRRACGVNVAAASDAVRALSCSAPAACLYDWRTCGGAAMRLRNVTVFGGSGFLGRYIVQRLAQRGARIRVATRDPEAARFLQPLGDVGQIMGVQANLRHEPSIRRAVAGADAVVNCVGILFERG